MDCTDLKLEIQWYVTEWLTDKTIRRNSMVILLSILISENQIVDYWLTFKNHPLFCVFLYYWLCTLYVTEGRRATTHPQQIQTLQLPTPRLNKHTYTHRQSYVFSLLFCFIFTFIISHTKLHSKHTHTYIQHNELRYISQVPVWMINFYL